MTTRKEIESVRFGELADEFAVKMDGEVEGGLEKFPGRMDLQDVQSGSLETWSPFYFKM